MSKDLTDALRAMMAGDANTNVVPALKPRGAAPAITSAAPLPGATKGTGGGIASPLDETAYADRTWHTEKIIASTDGLFSLRIKPVASVKFKDAALADVIIQFKAPS